MKRFQIEPLEERIAPSYMGGFDGDPGGSESAGGAGSQDTSAAADGGHPHEGRQIDHGGVYPDGTHSEPSGTTTTSQDAPQGSRSGYVHENAMDSSSDGGNPDGTVNHSPEGSNDSEIVVGNGGVKNH